MSQKHWWTNNTRHATCKLKARVRSKKRSEFSHGTIIGVDSKQSAHYPWLVKWDDGTTEWCREEALLEPFKVLNVFGRAHIAVGMRKNIFEATFECIQSSMYHWHRAFIPSANCTIQEKSQCPLCFPNETAHTNQSKRLY